MTTRPDPAHDFNVPNDWVREMLTVVKLAPQVEADVLGEAELHWAGLSTPGGQLRQRQEIAVVRALARQRGDSYFGAQLGLMMSGRTSTVVSYIMHRSRTLRDAVKNCVRAVTLTRPGARTTYEETDVVGRWRLDNRDPWVREDPIYAEFVTSVILAGFRTATGRPVRPMSVWLRATNRARVARLSHIWGCPVSTEADRHVVEFSRATLALPLLEFDAPLLKHLTDYSGLLMADAEAPAPDLRRDVECAILDRLTHGAPPVADIAADLGLSVRTLNRRLAARGVSYRGVLDAVRRHKAKIMLEYSGLSLAEIAFVLGYGEQSSFTTAFRRWTGVAPGSYRAAHQDAPVARPAGKAS